MCVSDIMQKCLLWILNWLHTVDCTIKMFDCSCCTISCMVSELESSFNDDASSSAGDSVVDNAVVHVVQKLIERWNCSKNITVSWLIHTIARCGSPLSASCVSSRVDCFRRSSVSIWSTVLPRLSVLHSSYIVPLRNFCSFPIVYG